MRKLIPTLFCAYASSVKTLSAVVQSASHQTPPDRDRVIDGMRAFALLGVVLGHLTMGLVLWQGSTPMIGNILASSTALQYLTWIFQVMPYFFIAGGAANSISWLRKDVKQTHYSDWLWNRIRRLLKPVTLYIAFMVIAGNVVSVFVSEATATPLLNLSTQLLWFLGVYIMVTALTPLIVWLENRFGFAPALGWLAIAIAIDLGRLYAGVPAPVGLLNFVFVWSFAAHTGIWYLRRKPHRLLLVGLIALAVLANYVLSTLTDYPISLVGIPGESFSNMAPPSIMMALHIVVCWCLVMLIKPAAQRLLQRDWWWRKVAEINLAAMTLYLWHIPVIIALTSLGHVMGWDRSVLLKDGLVVPGVGFLSSALVFWAFAFVVVWLFLQVAYVQEFIKLPWWDSQLSQTSAQVWRSWLSGLSAVLIGVGTLLISGSGLAGFPGRLVEFSGISWTPGFAVAVLLVGIICARAAVSLGRSPRPTTV